MRRQAYGAAGYQAFKRALQETVIPCHWCLVRRAVSPDHDPPLALGGDNSSLVGACLPCQYSRGGKLGQSLKRARRQERRRTIYEPWP